MPRAGGSRRPLVLGAAMAFVVACQGVLGIEDWTPRDDDAGQGADAGVGGSVGGSSGGTSGGAAAGRGGSAGEAGVSSGGESGEDGSGGMAGMAGAGGTPGTGGTAGAGGSGGDTGGATGSGGSVATGGTAGSGGSAGTGGTAGSGGGSSVCPVAQMCVAAPAGWQGPVVLLSGAEQSLLTCPGFAPATDFRSFSDLIAAESTCGCTCQSVPSSAQRCGNVQVGLGSPPCGPVPEAVRVTAVQDQCVNFSGSMEPSGPYAFVDIGPSAWSTTSQCTPQLAANIPDTGWDNAYLGCELPTSCETGGKCTPALAAGEELCVYVNDNVACPAGFPNRIDTWDGANDNRSCSACTCGAPTGTCTGGILFRDADCMPFRDALVTLSLNTCNSATEAEALFGTTSFGAQAAFSPSGGACAPSNSIPQGTVTMTGGRTVCCL